MQRAGATTPSTSPIAQVRTPAPLARNNIVTYLATQFDSLDVRGISDVDSLVLACVSYYQLPDVATAARTPEGMPIVDLYRADWFEGLTLGLWDPEGLVRLLGSIVASPRFRTIRLCDYVSETDFGHEQQFSACTLRLPTGDVYVSFRGTDNSIVGWKEDFNMAFETRVPSQSRAVRYLERAASFAEGRVYVGGHSKGGNLAAYAAAMCDQATHARIAAAFSHDGPGFTRETLSSPSWKESAGLIHKTVPRSSLIGMLFEQQEDFSTVESTSVGVLQHDPFSWIVDGVEFRGAEGLSGGADYLDRGLNDWISSMSQAERESFVDTLFSIFYASGEDTFADLHGNWKTTIPAMLAAVSKLDDEERGHLTHAIGLLAEALIPDAVPLGILEPGRSTSLRQPTATSGDGPSEQPVSPSEQG